MKAHRQDKVKQMVSYCPPTPSGSIFLFGKIGAGKSLAMFTISQRLHDFRNLKILDIWGGERNQGENLYWTIPSQFNEYWKFWEKKLRLDEVGSKQYRVNLLYPVFKKLPKKVPKLEKYVFSKIFRIPIKLISIREIKCVLGNLSASDETLWEDILSELGKSDGTAKLIKLFEKKKSTNTSLFKNFVNPLIESGTLCSFDSKDKLDISSEMRDKETISVLVHHHIPEKFNVFMMAWLLFQIWELSKVNKVPRDIILPIREASKFFRASDKSVLEDKYKIFKKYLDDFLRYARGKMHPIIDSQSPAETKGILDGNQDLSIIGLLPGAEDRQFVTEQFKRDGSMTDKQVKELGELEPGEYYFVIGKGKLAKKRYLLLPRTMYWREKDGNFYDIWETLHGSNAFYDFSKIYDNVLKEHKNMISELNLIEKEKKEIKKSAEEQKKKEIEERQEKEKLEKYKKELEEKQKIRKELKKKHKEEKTIKMVGDSEEVIKTDKQEEDLINLDDI